MPPPSVGDVEAAGGSHPDDMTDRYDVIIIGSGAGGGTLAHTLAPSGKRILLLERGDFLPREMENWNPDAVFVDGKYISPDTWYDADGKSFQPQVHYFVGGATKLYGAALVPAAAPGLRRAEARGRRHPAWPLSYDDFEPWYTKAEWLYQVHGDHGADPTEGPWSKRIRGRRSRTSPGSSRSPTPSQPAAITPSPRPCGILLDEAQRAGARASAAPGATATRAWCTPRPTRTIAVRPLLDQPNVTLLVDAEVVRLETDPTGRTVTDVVVTRNGRARPTGPASWRSRPEPPNSAKILLALGVNDRHPDGLANGSDQVGRNYMFHNSKAVVALSKEPNDTVFQKTLGINDFYFADEGRHWPSGTSRCSASRTPRR